MNELAVRTLTGAIMIMIALLAAYVGGDLFAVLVAAIAAAMFYEWTRLVRGWGAAWYAGGFVYAVLPALALLWIREREAHGLVLLIWTFIVTWSTDIGAYFAGRAIGGPKLAPSISPNKTIAGLVGGVICAFVLAAMWIGAVEWDSPVRMSSWLNLLAPIFAVAAQMGDLFESWLKRRARVKDSGNWLPGHGGVLDRLDGLVPVAVLTAAAQLMGLV